MIRFSFLQHKVDDASQLMGSGGNCTWRSMSGTHPPIVSAQSAITTRQTGCSHSQGSTDSILGWLHPRMDNLAASDFVIGAQAQPGRKMLFGRPLMHVCTDLAQYFLDRQSIQTIHLGQVHSRHPIQGRSEVKVSLV